MIDAFLNESSDLGCDRAKLAVCDLFEPVGCAPRHPDRQAHKVVVGTYLLRLHFANYTTKQ